MPFLLYIRIRIIYTFKYPKIAIRAGGLRSKVSSTDAEQKNCSALCWFQLTIRMAIAIRLSDDIPSYPHFRHVNISIF
jgi:hypothetical protein